jgi:hypothetical protein
MSLANDLERTAPQTEDAAERGWVREVDDGDLGVSCTPAEGDVGDIADEGPGHRG